jgi:glycerol-3-phosphate acyltransferase PlsY
LGSVVCAACFPLLINFIPFVTVTLEDGTLAGAPPVAIVTSVLMAALIIILHRQNIVRLWQGKESKISFKKKS